MPADIIDYLTVKTVQRSDLERVHPEDLEVGDRVIVQPIPVKSGEMPFEATVASVERQGQTPSFVLALRGLQVYGRILWRFKAEAAS